VIEIRQTEVYAKWFVGLRDRQARARRWYERWACSFMFKQFQLDNRLSLYPEASP
jgi:hypothetical protein